MLLILPHNKERLKPGFLYSCPVCFFHSLPLSFSVFLSTFPIISLLLFLSHSLCFIQQKQRSHITGTPEGYEKKDGREEKFKTKCGRELESVCDVAE